MDAPVFVISLCCLRNRCRALGLFSLMETKQEAPTGYRQHLTWRFVFLVQTTPSMIFLIDIYFKIYKDDRKKFRPC